MTRSAAIAAAYMLAVSQGGAMLRDDKACAARHLARWLGSREELLKA